MFGLAQDELGYIWIGTADGLNRYDGHEIKTLYRDPTIAQGLPDNYIRALTTSQNHQLYLSTNLGLVRYDLIKNHFFRIPEVEGNPQTHPPSFDEIIEDRDGVIWTVGEGNLFSVHNDTLLLHQFRQIKNHQPILFNSLIDACEGLILGSSSGLYSFSKTSSAFTAIQTPQLSGELFVLLEDQEKQLWFTDNSGRIGMMAADRKTLRTFELPSLSTSITAMAEIEPNRFLMGTLSEGVVEFTPEASEMFPAFYKHDPLNPASLSFNVITRIIKDREGLIWIGTDSGGLSMLDLRKKSFRHLSMQPGSTPRLHNNMIKEIYLEKDQDVLWYGTLDHGPGKISYNNGNPEAVKLLNDNQDFSVSYLSRINSGELILAGNDGVHIYNETSGKLNSFGHPPVISQTYSFKHINDAEIVNDTLWIAANYGVILFDIKRRRWIDDSNRVLPIMQSQHGVMIQKIDNLLFLGTYSSGLMIQDLTTNKLIQLSHNPADPESISHNSVKTVTKSRDGFYWIGTIYGLNRWHPSSDKVMRVTTENGLSNMYIYGVLEDDQEYLWISSNGGLSMYHPEHKTISNFTMADGLQSMEFNSNAYSKNETGLMAFGGLNGINVFHPDSVRAETKIYPVVLTGLRIDNRPFLSDIQPSYLRTVKLRPGEKNVTFDFRSLSYAGKDNVSYRYIMEGFDQFWTQSGAANQARYTNLPPGKYTFRVRTEQAPDVITPTGLNIQLEIIPPVWHTWWFRVFLLVTVIGALWGVFRWNVYRRLEKQKKILERKTELERERNRIATDIHDEVGAGLTRISLLSELIRNDEDISSRNKEWVREISSNTALVLSQLDEIVWALNPRNDTTIQFVDYVIEFVSEFLKDSSIRFRFDVPADLEHLECTAEIRHQSFLCIRETLTNILKYASASQVTIKISQESSVLKVIITDDGRGFDTQTIGTFCNGLTNMTERMKAVGGSVIIQTETGLGTTVSILAPCL